jgi:hypothetical protein
MYLQLVILTIKLSLDYLMVLQGNCMQMNFFISDTCRFAIYLTADDKICATMIVRKLQVRYKSDIRLSFHISDH